MSTYSELIEMISENSNFSLREIKEKVLEKQKKISGLVSKEGAAQIVAAEMGVDLKKINKKSLEERIKNFLKRVEEKRYNYDKEQKKIRRYWKIISIFFCNSFSSTLDICFFNRKSSFNNCPQFIYINYSCFFD